MNIATLSLININRINRERRLYFLLSIVGGLLLPLRYLGIADPIVKKCQAIVVSRLVAGKSQVAYYCPALQVIRHETDSETLIINFKKERGYIITKSAQGLARRIDFKSFRSADEAVSRYTKRVLGASFGNGKKKKKWALLSFKNEMDLTEIPACHPATVVNQFREKHAMCVIRDPRVKRLAFLQKHVEALPDYLRKRIESSAELFLYGHGIVPVRLHRRGLPVSMERFSVESLSNKWFRVPQRVRSEPFGTQYKDIYLQLVRKKSE